MSQQAQSACRSAFLRTAGAGVRSKLEEAQKLCPFVKDYFNSVGKAQNPQAELDSLAHKCPYLARTGACDSVESKCPASEWDFSSLPDVPAHKKLVEVASKGGAYHAMRVEPAKKLSCCPFFEQVRRKNDTYEKKFADSIKELHDEGRYRQFANLQRDCGNFPNAMYRPPPKTDDAEIASTEASSDVDSANNSPQHRAEKLRAVQEKYPVKIFCSNDYLGMGQNAKVLAKAHEVLNDVGMGAGGTRNISGNTYYHELLEQELAGLHQKEKGLIFSSGYVANEAALSVFGKLIPDMALLSDADNHASMIEGMRHSKLDKHIFKHNDMEDLERQLEMCGKDRPKMIIFESVYSMTGAIADFQSIVRLAKKWNAMTFVDEVHAVGMYGAHGAGIAEKMGYMEDMDIISGTLGKAYGAGGGYIVGSANYVDCVRSFASGFIFTTALAPVVAGGAQASVAHLRGSNEERLTQKVRVAYLKKLALENELPYMDNPSHITPIFVGDPVKCKQLTDNLLEKHHIYLQPINYPTVPRTTERVRITPGPLHTPQDIEYLIQALVTEWKALGLPSRREYFDRVLDGSIPHLPQCSIEAAEVAVAERACPKKMHVENLEPACVRIGMGM